MFPVICEHFATLSTYIQRPPGSPVPLIDEDGLTPHANQRRQLHLVVAVVLRQPQYLTALVLSLADLLKATVPLVDQRLGLRLESDENFVVIFPYLFSYRQ